MLIRQDATVCEDETVGGSVCRLLLLSELACHFGQSVHAVIVPCAAEGGQAAQNRDWFWWIDRWEGKVVAG